MHILLKCMLLQRVLLLVLVLPSTHEAVPCMNTLSSDPMGATYQES